MGVFKIIEDVIIANQDCAIERLYDKNAVQMYDSMKEYFRTIVGQGCLLVHRLPNTFLETVLVVAVGKGGSDFFL